jgi:hypothetical protein
MVALLAVPSVGGARAAVKKFTASISPSTATGQAPGTWTETITNCGAPLPAPCTVSSTINLGTIQIQVPVEFRPITSVSASFPSGQPTRNWTVSYDPATGRINGFANGGTDKLLPGESILITFEATPSTCSGPTEPFTTSAWGSTPSPGQDLFAIVGNQPTVNITGCGVASGGSITDPVTGQTETINGDFQGHVNITFGGAGPDCSSEAGFGALGAQWEVYHLPTQVNITPADDFVAGQNDKVSTSEFNLPAGGGDSSWFLICFAVPQAGHTAFETRGGGTAVAQTIDGVPNFVGILASCADAPTPCVSEQFLTTGPGAPPWSPAANKVHIAVRMEPGDPYKR